MKFPASSPSLTPSLLEATCAVANYHRAPRDVEWPITESPGSVTELLLAWRDGDEAALARLTLLVHQELRRIARRCMRGERAGHSLQATALVNEAYLRLLDVQHVNWRDRAHFMAMTARMMRRILVEFARAKVREKRGGGWMRVSLGEDLLTTDKGHDLVALDDALEALAQLDERKSRVVELRFFGGLEWASAMPSAHPTPRPPA